MVLPVPTDSQEEAVQSMCSGSSSTCSSELHSCFSSASEQFLSDLESEVGNCCTQSSHLDLQADVSQNGHAQNGTEKLEEGEDVPSRISCAEKFVTNKAFPTDLLSTQKRKQGSNKPNICIITKNSNSGFTTTKGFKSTTRDVQQSVIVQPQSRGKNVTSDTIGCPNWKGQSRSTLPSLRYEADKQRCHNTSQMETVPHSRSSSGKRHAETWSPTTKEQSALVCCGISMQTRTIHSSLPSLQKVTFRYCKTRSRSCPLPLSPFTKSKHTFQTTTKPNIQPHGSSNHQKTASASIQSKVKCNGKQQKASDHECWVKKPSRDDWRSRVVVSRVRRVPDIAENRTEVGKLKHVQEPYCSRFNKEIDDKNSVWKTGKGMTKDKEYFESLLQLLKWKTEFVNSPTKSKAPNVTFVSSNKGSHNVGDNVKYDSVVGSQLVTPDYVKAKNLETDSAAQESNMFTDNSSPEDFAGFTLWNSAPDSLSQSNLNRGSLSGNIVSSIDKQPTCEDQDEFKPPCKSAKTHLATLALHHKLETQKNLDRAFEKPTTTSFTKLDDSNLQKCRTNLQLHPRHGISNVNVTASTNTTNVNRSSMPDLGAKALHLIQTCKTLRFTKSDQDEISVTASNEKSIPCGDKAVAKINSKNVLESKTKKKLRKHSMWKSMPRLEGCKRGQDLIEKLCLPRLHGKSMPESLDELDKAMDIAAPECVKTIEGNNRQNELSTKPNVASKFDPCDPDGINDNLPIGYSQSPVVIENKLDRANTYTLITSDCQEEVDDNSQTALVNDQYNEKCCIPMPKSFMTKMKAKKILANLITSSPANILQAEFIREMIVRNWMMRRMQSGADYTTVTRGQQPIPDICLDYVYKTQAYGCGDKGLMTYHRPVPPNMSTPRRLDSEEITCCGLGRRSKKEQAPKEEQTQLRSQQLSAEQQSARRRLKSPAPSYPFTVADDYEPHVGLKHFDFDEEQEVQVAHRNVPRFLNDTDQVKSEAAPEEEYWGDWEEEPCDDNDFDDVRSLMEIPEPSQYTETKNVKENWSSPTPPERDLTVVITTSECQYSHELSNRPKELSPPVKETSFTKPNIVHEEKQNLITSGNSDSSRGFLSISPPKRSLTGECLALVHLQSPDKEVQTMSLPELSGTSGYQSPFPSKMDAATATEVLVYTVQVDESTTMDRAFGDSETEDEGDVEEDTEPLTSEGEGELVETLSAETQTKPVVILQVPLLKTQPQDGGTVKSAIEPFYTDATTSTEATEAFDVSTATSKMNCFEVGVDAPQTVCIEAATETQLACLTAATETCFKTDVSTESPKDLPVEEIVYPSQIVVCSGRIPPPVHNKVVLVGCEHEQTIDPAQQVICSGYLNPPLCPVEPQHKFMTLEHVCPLPHSPQPSSRSSSLSYNASNSPHVSPRPDLGKVQTACTSPRSQGAPLVFQQGIDLPQRDVPQQDLSSPYYNTTPTVCYPCRMENSSTLPPSYTTQQENENRLQNEMNNHMFPQFRGTQGNSCTSYNHSEMPQFTCFPSLAAQGECRNSCLSPYYNEIAQPHSLSREYREMSNSTSYSSHTSRDGIQKQCTTSPQQERPRCIIPLQTSSSPPLEIPRNVWPHSSEVPYTATCNYMSKLPHETPVSSQQQCNNRYFMPTEMPMAMSSQYDGLESESNSTPNNQQLLVARSPGLIMPHRFQPDDKQLASNEINFTNSGCRLCKEEIRKLLDRSCQHNIMEQTEHANRVCQMHRNQQTDNLNQLYTNYCNRQIDADITFPCHQMQQTEWSIQKESTIQKCCSLQGEEFVRRMTPIHQQTTTPQSRISSGSSPAPSKRKQYSQKHRSTIRSVPTSHSLPEESKSRPMSRYMSEHYSDSDADLSGSASEPTLGRDFESNSKCKNCTSSLPQSTSQKLFQSAGTNCAWPNRVAGSRLSMRSGRLSPGSGRGSPTTSSERTLTPIFEEVEPSMPEEMQPTREGSDQNILQWLLNNRSHITSENCFPNNNQQSSRTTDVNPTDCSEQSRNNDQTRLTAFSNVMSFDLEASRHSVSCSIPTQTRSPNRNNQCSTCTEHPISHDSCYVQSCCCPPETRHNSNPSSNSGNKNELCVRTCVCSDTSENKVFNASLSTTTPLSNANLCFCSICRNTQDDARCSIQQCKQPLHSNLSLFGHANCGASYFFETTCCDKESPTLYLQAGECSGRYGHPRKQIQQNPGNNNYSLPTQNVNQPQPVSESQTRSPGTTPASLADQPQHPIFFVTSHGLSEERSGHNERVSPHCLQIQQMEHEPMEVQTGPSPRLSSPVKEMTTENQACPSGCVPCMCNCCNGMLGCNTPASLFRYNPHENSVYQETDICQSHPLRTPVDPQDYACCVNGQSDQMSNRQGFTKPTLQTMKPKPNVEIKSQFLEGYHNLPGKLRRGAAFLSQPTQKGNFPSKEIPNICHLQQIPPTYQCGEENFNIWNNQIGKANMNCCMNANCAAAERYYIPKYKLCNDAKPCMEQDEPIFNYVHSPQNCEDQRNNTEPQMVCCRMPSPKKLIPQNGQPVQVTITDGPLPQFETLVNECGQEFFLNQLHATTCCNQDHSYNGNVNIRSSPACYDVTNYELPQTCTCCGVSPVNNVAQQYPKYRSNPNEQYLEKKFNTCCRSTLEKRACQNACSISPVKYPTWEYDGNIKEGDGQLPKGPVRIINENCYSNYPSSPLMPEMLNCVELAQSDCHRCSSPLKCVAPQCGCCKCKTDTGSHVCRCDDQNCSIQVKPLTYKRYNEHLPQDDVHCRQNALCGKLHPGDISMKIQRRTSPLKCRAMQKNQKDADSQYGTPCLQDIVWSESQGHEDCKTKRLPCREESNFPTADDCKLIYVRQLQPINNTDAQCANVQHKLPAVNEQFQQPCADAQCSTTDMKYWIGNCPSENQDNTKQWCQIHGHTSMNGKELGNVQHSHTPVNRNVIGNPCTLQELLCRKIISDKTNVLPTKDSACTDSVGESAEQEFSGVPFFSYHEFPQGDREGTLHNGTSPTLIQKEADMHVEQNNEPLLQMKCDHGNVADEIQNSEESQTEPINTDVRYHVCSPMSRVRIEQLICGPNDRVWAMDTNPLVANECYNCVAQCTGQEQSEAPLPVLYRRSCSPGGTFQSSAIPHKTKCPRQVLQLTAELLRKFNKANNGMQEEMPNWKIPIRSEGTMPFTSPFTESRGTSESPSHLSSPQVPGRTFQPIHDCRCTTVTPDSNISTTPSCGGRSSMQCSPASSGKVDCSGAVSPMLRCCLPCSMQQTEGNCKHGQLNSECCYNQCSKLHPACPQDCCIASRAVCMVDASTGKRMKTLQYEHVCSDRSPQVRHVATFTQDCSNSSQTSPVRRCSTGNAQETQECLNTGNMQPVYCFNRDSVAIQNISTVPNSLSKRANLLETSTQAKPSVIATGTSNCGFSDSIQATSSSDVPTVSAFVPTLQQELFQNGVPMGYQQNNPCSPSASPTQSCSGHPCSPASNGSQCLGNKTNVENSYADRFVPRSPCNPSQKRLPQKMQQRSVSPGIPSKYLVPSAYYKTLQPDPGQSSDCIMNVLALRNSTDMHRQHWGADLCSQN